MPVTQVAMISGSNLEISVDQVGKDATVRPSGQINVYSSPDLRDSLQALLSKEPLPQTVTVDLAGVSSIETSGVATLIEALRIARHRHVARRRHGAHHGGESAEQYRRPYPVARPPTASPAVAARALYAHHRRRRLTD